MPNEQQLILVRTPQIKPDESFRGYFLRLAEANGYGSQASIFALANNNRRCSPNPTLERAIQLKKLLGGGDHLLHNCNRREDDSHFSVMGLRFHKSAFRTTSAICPDCIRDFGYIPAFTDLKSIRCCPVHRKWLIDTCPACAKSIPWFRPGLRMCTCGTTLSHLCGTSVPPPQKEIANAVRFAKALYGEFSPGTFHRSDARTRFSHLQLIAAISANRRFVESAKSLNNMAKKADYSMDYQATR